MLKKKGCTRSSPGGSEDAVTAAIQEKYGAAARRVTAGASGPSSCCGSVAVETDPITRDLYDGSQAGQVPAEALQASLGCGNPTALADLAPGQVVLDLGSGGGIDVLLSARRVAPGGKAYGVDMTDEMLALARENQRKAGITNAEFLKGQIEAVPLSDASVDVVISNCVLNLSVNKPKAFAEAFRVLRPGGLFAVSDIVVRGEMPAEVRRSLELYLGCFAGALDERKFEELLSLAGFTDVSIVPTRVYSADVARPLLANAGLDPMLAEMLDGRFASAFVRARKPK